MTTEFHQVQIKPQFVIVYDFQLVTGLDFLKDRFSSALFQTNSNTYQFVCEFAIAAICNWQWIRHLYSKISNLICGDLKKMFRIRYRTQLKPRV